MYVSVLVGGFGVDEGRLPLPTRPLRYCDSASLVPVCLLSVFTPSPLFPFPPFFLLLRYKTSPVSGNSINPIWNEEPFVFKKVVLPNLAHLRFCVYDENGKMLGHRVIPVRGLRPGYRHIHLRNEINQPVPLATLFIYLEVRDYVPDDFSGKAALITMRFVMI